MTPTLYSNSLAFQGSECDSDGSRRQKMPKKRTGNRQAPHRTTTSFSLDKALLKLVNDEVEARIKAGENVDRSKVIQEALVQYLGLKVVPTKIEIEGPPTYKRSRKTASK